MVERVTDSYTSSICEMSIASVSLSGLCNNFSCELSRRVIASLHNVPMETGGNGCSCMKQTQHFSTFCEDICDFFLQRKYEDYEIMQAPHILRGNRHFMRRKCGLFEKMRPPHKYAG